ncbi:hypothetical protein TNCV_4428011 [Trichonephila clavipes]|nr:hypothetical protein TNCV_4428011 [Trichonephila clavipes]
MPSGESFRLWMSEKKNEGSNQESKSQFNGCFASGPDQQQGLSNQPIAGSLHRSFEFNLRQNVKPTRAAIGDGPRNLESWGSSDENDITAGIGSKVPHHVH